MVRTCWISYMIGFMLVSIASGQYNQPCTFSSGTCHWSVGRRWQVQNLDDEIDDQILIAIDRSNQDKEIGFTDAITSSWLSLTPACSFDIRLTFQFSIENEQDQIEVFLINKDKSQISSIGQWKALTNNNAFEDIESLWQQADITFKAAEEYRIEIEIRHLPDKKIDSTTWFAVDDILIETCSDAQTTSTTTMTSPIYPDINNSFSPNDPLFRLRGRWNDTTEESMSARLTLFTSILYIIGALIVLIFITILLILIIFIYRKHCLPSSISITDPRRHSSRRKKYDHNHIDADARTERTVMTTIRPY